MRYAKRCEKKEEGRVYFWAVSATGANPSKGLASCGGNTGAWALLSALWAAGKALLKGL